MRVLKVIAEGITTSFRYPHFMQQIQPTLPMPPPATIFGHIASVLGKWFDPSGVKFAYHFTYSGQVKDLEHIIVLSPATGKLKKTDIPKVLEGNINPFERHMFFLPRLTLYINKPEWEDSFRSPYYPVILGRSQDLFTYTLINTIELEYSDQVYFENTLLPYTANKHTNRGFAILMPRYIDYAEKRRPTFARYFVVKDRIDTRTDDFLWFEEGKRLSCPVDKSEAVYNGAFRGLAFHSFIGEIDETFVLAGLD